MFKNVRGFHISPFNLQFIDYYPFVPAGDLNFRPDKLPHCSWRRPSAVSQRFAKPPLFFDCEAMTATIRWSPSVNALSLCIPADSSPTNKIFTGIVP